MLISRHLLDGTRIFRVDFMQWSRRFDVKNVNPNNFQLIVSKSMGIKVWLEHEGFTIKGASGRFTKNKTWDTRPKLVLNSKKGKKVHDLEALKRPTECKSLIAILYSICHLGGVEQNANLFYNDNKGIQTSIATRHGPEKSEYMKKLIAVLEDSGFIKSISAEITRPLPENLSDLHLEMIENCKENRLSDLIVRKLLEKYSLTCKELERERLELADNSGVDNHRIPEIIQWPTLTLQEHENRIQDEIHSATISIKSENDLLKKELEITKDVLSNTKDSYSRVMSRSLWARIMNKRGN